MRTILVLGFVLGLATACGSGRAAARGAIDVVAAENAYGDVAAQIGGAHVSVTSILSAPNADPHLFEPGTRNGLAVAQARLVIQNGAGYDAFMTKLEVAAPSTHRIVVTIADVVGVHGRDANPHLWYDVPALGRIAGAIATGLERADSAHTSAYRAGLRRFTKSLQPLLAQVAQIKRSFAGTPVAYTEPVPGYLIAAAGLRNLAPVSFTRAIEDGTEPTPQAVAAVDALVRGRKIAVLLYNTQAVSPLTARVRSEAASAAIPVVGVTETLPPHLSFQQWQLAQAHALYRALAR
jgi:zinc/manganese transport system substrate-binding protein